MAETPRWHGPLIELTFMFFVEKSLTVSAFIKFSE